MSGGARSVACTPAARSLDRQLPGRDDDGRAAVRPNDAIRHAPGRNRRADRPGGAGLRDRAGPVSAGAAPSRATGAATSRLSPCCFPHRGRVRTTRASRCVPGRTRAGRGRRSAAAAAARWQGRRGRCSIDGSRDALLAGETEDDAIGLPRVVSSVRRTATSTRPPPQSRQAGNVRYRTERAKTVHHA